MKISVIMLTYNREQLVGRAIESILAQTMTDFEFIIVDNGSTDRSGAIADEYAARDSRIHVIHRERGNIGAGRNTGLDAARGEYIAFIDDDDWAEPDFLEFLYTLIVETEADMSICGAADKAFDEKRIMNAEEALITLLWRKYFSVGFPLKLIRKTLFDSFRFSEETRYDDIDAMPQIIANTDIVAYHGLAKYVVTRHEGNHSAWTTNHVLLTPETLKEYLDVYHRRTQWLSERFPESIDKWQYFEWSFMVSMVKKIEKNHLADCHEQLCYMQKALFLNKRKFLTSLYILPFEIEWMKQFVIPWGDQ